MSTEQMPAPGSRKPLRLWPGVAAAALVVLFRFVAPFVLTEGGVIGMLGGVAAALLILIWWLLFSRVPWVERAGAVLVMVVALLALTRVAHESIINGFMGRMLPLFSIPLLMLALVIGVAVGRRLPGRRRFAVTTMAIALAATSVALVRSGGVSGEGSPDLHWRWTPTPEHRLLAATRDEVLPPPAASAEERAAGAEPTPDAAAAAPAPAAAPPSEPDTAKSARRGADRATPDAAANGGAASAGIDPPARRVEWPGFRGASRDGVVRGVAIDTDWSAKPPVELWRRAIGPGWSSFAVSGDLFYTQEQRGEEELVSCYRVSTGEPVWRHRDPVRFWESNAGPGPRATPTLHDGRVYTMGGTGVVNALDARTGKRIWSRRAGDDTEKEIPEWGVASSPLVVGDLVIAAVNGRLIAYDIATGHPRWLGPPEGGGYSSPHPAVIDGVPQILLLRGRRTTSVAPADGAVLWEYSWQPGASIVQPALLPDGDVVIHTADAMGGQGLRRLAVARGPSGWTVEERWTTRGLKPYFNDFVVHKGYAFGFDGSILSAIGLADGERVWKGGRYGHGQMLLLPEQDLLLILSENGDLVLVGAVPEGHREIARIPAIDGKTWNHPVLAGDVLLVRNGEEMAAFRLAVRR